MTRTLYLNIYKEFQSVKQIVTATFDSLAVIMSLPKLLHIIYFYYLQSTYHLHIYLLNLEITTIQVAIICSCNVH